MLYNVHNSQNQFVGTVEPQGSAEIYGQDGTIQRVPALFLARSTTGTSFGFLTERAAQFWLFLQCGSTS